MKTLWNMIKTYWNQTDKLQHFIGGLIIAQVVAVFTTLPIGLHVGVIVGTLKEIIRDFCLKMVIPVGLCRSEA